MNEKERTRLDVARVIIRERIACEAYECLRGFVEHERRERAFGEADRFIAAMIASSESACRDKPVDKGEPLPHDGTCDSVYGDAKAYDAETFAKDAYNAGREHGMNEAVEAMVKRSKEFPTASFSVDFFRETVEAAIRSMKLKSAPTYEMSEVDDTLIEAAMAVSREARIVSGYDSESRTFVIRNVVWDAFTDAVMARLTHREGPHDE